MSERISSRFQRKPTNVRELRSEDAMMVQDDNYSFLIFSVALQGTGDKGQVTGPNAVWVRFWALHLYPLPEENYLCQT